jgi:hypothetical protein
MTVCPRLGREVAKSGTLAALVTTRGVSAGILLEAQVPT